MKPTEPRVEWIAGTRAEILALGPLFPRDRIPRAADPKGAGHRFLFAAEHGMAGYQALDFLGLRPHETLEIRHPAEDPAIRLRGLMEGIEAEVRRRRATHLVFSGFGPTAAACALTAHARGCRTLWIRPLDSARLVGRLRWEAGLTATLEGLAATARAFDEREGAAGRASSAILPLDASLLEFAAPEPAREGVALAGLRDSAPVALVAVGRRIWGMTGLFARLATAVAGAAAARPETEWIVASALDARLEGSVRSLEAAPPNLHLVPPMPPEEYAALLARARFVLTDSPHVASDAIAGGVPVAALGEVPDAADGRIGAARSIAAAEPVGAPVAAILPADVAAERLAELHDRSATRPAPARRTAAEAAALREAAVESATRRALEFLEAL